MLPHIFIYPVSVLFKFFRINPYPHYIPLSKKRFKMRLADHVRTPTDVRRQ